MKKANSPSRHRPTNARFSLFGDDIKSTSAKLKVDKKEKSIAESTDPGDKLLTIDEKARRRRYIWAKAIHGKGLLYAVKEFFRKLPYRLWKSFIDSFLIPHYRPEWGKYIKWDITVFHEGERRKNRNISLRTASRKSSKSSRQRNQKVPPKRKHVKKKYATDLPPRPVYHDHSECVPVRINVSGQIFEPQLRTLRQFPDTLLGNPRRMIQFYDPERDEFFFDRHRSSFEAILYYFNTAGILRRPLTVPLETFVDEIKFYDLGPVVLSSFQRQESSNEDDRPLPKNLLKRKLWLLFEYPESSYQSQIVAYISILAVCISIFEFCIETLPDFDNDRESNADPNRKDEVNDALYLGDPFFFTETICIIFFVVEYIMRSVTSPNYFNFVKEISNLIDLIAIMPYFLNILYYIDDSISGNTHHTTSGVQNRAISLTIFRIIRLVRVFRILKLSRHNRGLKILGKTLRASSRELGLLMFFLMVGVLVFSSALFFAEAQYEDSPYTSIPKGFWFAVVTMTTLGYGDLVPVGPFGKVIGALCAIAGVLTISLPVPVIVSNFNMFYNSEEASISQSSASTDGSQCKHVEHCPYYPAWYTRDGQVVGDKMSKNANLPDNCDDSCSTRWLMGEQKPDFSDSDFDELLKDDTLKHTALGRRKTSKVSHRATKLYGKSTMTNKRKSTGMIKKQ